MPWCKKQMWKHLMAAACTKGWYSQTIVVVESVELCPQELGASALYAYILLTGVR